MRHRRRRHHLTMLLVARAARALRPAPRRGSVRMLASRMPTLELRDASTKNIIPVNNDAGPLKWYACGPTVYDATHLGHARTYVTLDLVRRAAETIGGATIDFAMGVTDIDDKIIKRAAELGMEPLELARVEEANFFEDLERLGCRAPTLVLRVSEHIEDIVQFTQEVVEQGYGYTTTDGSVWFDVAKLGSSYGAFAEGRGTSTAAAQAAALVAEDPASASDAKRDQRDFALWKAVWKSKFYGAFVLNHRVVLHTIDATPARWRGDAGSSALDSASTDTSSPRNDLVKYPTHWLISTQVGARESHFVSGHGQLAARLALDII